MGRRAKPLKKNAEAKRPPPGQPPKNDDARVRDLEKRLAESLEREKAAGEILRVISSSPTDVQPVFDTIVQNAMRLCDAVFGRVFRRRGDTVLLAANANFPDELGHHPAPLNQDTLSGGVISSGQLHLSVDVESDPAIPPLARETFRHRGVRSILTVPMLREGQAIGAISVGHRNAGAFTDAHVALLQTFADQAVIAIENVRLFTALGARNQDLTEALARQAATSEILRVISSSPTDVQPVFNAIVQSAERLCGAQFSVLVLFEGELVHFAAHHNLGSEALEEAGRIWPTRPTRASGAGRAILDRRVVQIADIESDAEYRLQSLSRAVGHRSSIYVPMLRDGAPIGVIVVARVEPGNFPDNQVSLLQTFADQAVIALENVRLFTELQASNRDLTRALEQQTATSEILRVISRSPTTIAPVFEAIVTNGRRLCHAHQCLLVGFDGEMLTWLASDNFSPAREEALRSIFPYRPTRGGTTGRVVLDRDVVHIPDVLEDADHGHQEVSMKAGARAQLAVPLFRENEVIGALHVARPEPGPFSDDQIALLKTFADQAVIAIENVHLFTELEARNRDLSEALARQTATAEILRVISGSRTEVQPVFGAIARSAVGLCGALNCALWRIEGGLRETVSFAGRTSPEWEEAVQGTRDGSQPGTVVDWVMAERRVLHIPDIELDHRFPLAREIARTMGYRSCLVVPMLRSGEVVGVIILDKEEGPFSEGHIQLMQTFADQAVIAIENARLLTELQARTQELTRSVGQLTALGEVGRAVSSSLDLDTVLTTIVGRAVQLSGTDGGTIFEYDEAAEEFSPRATLNADESQSALLRATRLRRGEGAVGQMAVTREPLQIPDIAAEGAYESRLRGALLEAGTRAVLAIPLLHEERIVGGLVVTRRTPGAFTTEIVEILRTFATQSALAIENARLFREIERKSRELEVASQHKSDFLANMSHELRTPLNAIIGYSELLEEEAGDLDGGRLVPDLQKIAVAAKHQLSLINDILDLSKVEAGRMELERSAFDLAAAIDDAILLMRERASRRGITLERHVEGGVGAIRADERKVKQVLLNLLSNAVKFTPAGGRIEVRAGMADGDAEIAVTDTGSGIAPEDHDAVFEEFRQVGTAEKKAEGTGLGLALCRKFVELHGGRIWVRSQVGEGSTFTFTLPVRREEMGA
jgi:GAF domain-containing protein